MSLSKLLAASAALALVAGCDAKIGKDADNQPANQTATADKAEAGKFSIKAPGFDMKIDIPESVTDHATIKSDSDIIYPGAKMSGLHIDAEDKKAGSGVALRFTSGDAPAKLADWYRAKDRGEKFAIDSDRQQGESYTFAGHENDDGNLFTIQLSPASAGGTEGVLTVRDHD